MRRFLFLGDDGVEHKEIFFMELRSIFFSKKWKYFKLEVVFQ